MAARAAKLRKLDEFRRRLPHVSQSALHAVLKAVELDGVPELCNRWQMQEATNTILHAPTPYGPIRQQIQLPLESGDSYALEVAHPLAMLWTAARQSGSFSEYFLHRIHERPPTMENQWSLVIYTDEIVPGNPLGHDNKRKAWVFYYSFVELGMHALCNEDAWFLLAATRSSNVKAVAGGLSTPWNHA